MTERNAETLEGVVSDVIYQSEETGYTVLRLEAGREELTAVGCMPGVAPGERLTLHGEWSVHPSYGRQFRAAAVERRMPEGARAIYEYLASGVIRGVGGATARRIVEEFGEEALAVIEEEPEKLTRIKGMTLKRARSISDTFRSQMGMRLLLDYLTAHGLPPQLGLPLYRRYGALALELLKSDPYVLVDREIGVDFSAADALALDGGMAPDDPARREAGLRYELEHNLSNGHVFLPRGKLLAATGQLLDLPADLLADSLDDLTGRGALVQEEAAGETAVYLEELHRAEEYIAQRLLEMAGRELLPPGELEELAQAVQREQGIVYAPQQLEAIRLAATRQVMLLTGGPGTGKTTSLRGALALFDQLGLETALAAPTGRAAKRLGELCGAEGATIHRLLETRFDPQTGKLAFTHDEDEPLPADAVIVDETSMVDVPLMEALLRALRGDCRLILVGDPDQLPSVGPGNLLGDLLRSGALPAVRLTEVFRQAAESAIIRNAHQIDRGEHPPFHENRGDFFLLTRHDPARAVETIVELCRDRLPRNMGIPAGHIQVLSPTRKGPAGTGALNRALQAALNPPAPDKGERPFGDGVFRAGDRVMQVKNDYDVLWRDQATGESGMGIFNGDIGTVLRVEGGELTVDFEGKEIVYSGESLNELELAYAVTVHKALGSEYRAVVLSALPGPPMLLTRGVLYTAVTRARELFIAVGEEDILRRMVDNDRQTRRYSGLRWRLARGDSGLN